jgi:hypothetical protein
MCGTPPSAAEVVVGVSALMQFDDESDDDEIPDVDRISLTGLLIWLVADDCSPERVRVFSFSFCSSCLNAISIK